MKGKLSIVNSQLSIKLNSDKRVLGHLFPEQLQNPYSLSDY